MDDSEFLILFFGIGLALAGMGITSVAWLHRLYFRGNPAPGIVRVGVLLAMGWILYVLLNHADPSVTGVYVFFYLVLGYAAVKLAGQAGAGMFGLRMRLDVGERRNVPAAVVIAAFTVATGLIFGGSLWGEADAVGDDEGGWWIPVSFFLLGWGVLLVAFGLFLGREKGRLAHRMRRERSLADARAAATFLVSAAVPLTDAVAGDFWGWRHGLLSFGLLAALLLVHEAFSAWTREDDAIPGRRTSDARRTLESAAYLGLALLTWVLSRSMDAFLGAG
jgi:hypothetical protein